MTRKKPAPPEIPIEMDLPRIEDSMRRLFILAWEQNAPDGRWTGEEDRTEIGRLIRRPVAMAAQLAVARLQNYLASTIGMAASNEIMNRLNAEHHARCQAHARAPEPGEARH